MRWLVWASMAIAVAVVASFLVTSPVAARLGASVEAAPSPTLTSSASSGTSAPVDMIASGSSATSAPVDVITSARGQLFLDGKPYHFLSVDASNAATLWSVNWGCSWQPSDADLDALFASLPPRTLVPFWATQAMAYNDHGEKRIDFTAIDRVFAAAGRHDQFVMPELETQQGYCSDGHWKDLSWYEGGYRSSFDDDGRGLEPLPYWQYIQLIVPRYRNSPALGMWELMVEPEAANCSHAVGSGCYGHTVCPPGAAAALQSFFSTVGGEVKQLDPNHLISSGTIGGGQCGTAGPDWARVMSTRGVDVCSVHDYDDASLPISSGWQADIDACHGLGKPTIVGETGLDGSAAAGEGCQTTAVRARSFERRIAAFLTAGVSGLAVWGWSGQTAAGGCGYGVALDDPLMEVLRSAG
jgi:mannan endo-1,4-beta-mannosidase